MKGLLALAVLFVPLFIGRPILGGEFMIGENLRHERVSLPANVPERNGMVIIDSWMFVEDGSGAGVLVFYDDPRTKIHFDYIELYDIEGSLLVVAWIDRFGICQVAMDRGLMNSADPAVDGTFVMVSVGLAL